MANKIDVYQGTFCLSCEVCGDIDEAEGMADFRKAVKKHLKEFPDHTDMRAIRLVFVDVLEV